MFHIYRPADAVLRKRVVLEAIWGNKCTPHNDLFPQNGQNGPRQPHWPTDKAHSPDAHSPDACLRLGCEPEGINDAVSCCA